MSFELRTGAFILILVLVIRLTSCFVHYSDDVAVRLGLLEVSSLARGACRAEDVHMDAKCLTERVPSSFAEVSILLMLWICICSHRQLD